MNILPIFALLQTIYYTNKHRRDSMADENGWIDDDDDDYDWDDEDYKWGDDEDYEWRD